MNDTHDSLLKKSTAESSKETQIQAELIKNLYLQWRGVLLGVFTTATGISIIFYNEIPRIMNFTWLFSIYVFLFIRHLSVLKFRSGDYDSVQTLKWGRVFAFFAFLSGLAWGIASIVFFTPENLQLFNVLTLIIIAMSVGSLGALSSYPFAYYVFVLPTMLPIIWRYTNIDAPGYDIFGWLMIVFLLALFSFSRVNYKMMRQSVELRFRNMDLIHQLTEQKNVAEQANIAKTKFLAAASHDLRQPLHAIGLFLSSLMNKVEKDDQKIIVEKIQKSSCALNDLLDSLLDISKLDAGVVHTENNVFSLGCLFDTLKNEFEPNAREKNIRLSFVCTRLWLNSDYQILERVMRNLISNAIRYTNTGGIVVGCRRRKGKILLAVYDTGIGIRKENIQDIFKEFHQLGNPERDRSKGLGLGLAIVKRMSTLLKLNLLTVSKPGKGSMFALEIPESIISNPLNRDSLTDAIVPFFDKKRVLVVDDEMAIRDGLTELLRSWHCDVTSATSGDEAVDNLQYIRPDIMLVDYRLRNNETGSDVIKKVRALFSGDEIPAVIITGDTAPDRIKDASTGSYEILHKPVSPDVLRLLLGRICRN